MEIPIIQKRLMEGLPIISYNKEEINYLSSPIGQQLYKRATVNDIVEPIIIKKSRKHPNDIIECHICGEQIKRHYQSHHRETKVCQLYLKMNIKLRGLLMDK